MRKRLTKSELNCIESLQNRIYHLMAKLEKDDVPLDFGNESVYTQLGCACASLECILQEY